MAFRYRGRLAVTLVAKATFAIVPEGVAELVAPREVVSADRTWGDHPTKSLAAASELAPYLPRCDVVLTGHAHPRDAGASMTAARLALARAGKPLLDKTLHVRGGARGGSRLGASAGWPITYEHARGGPGEPNPVGTDAPTVLDPADPSRMGGFGPIAPFWPERRRLLGSIDRRALLGAPVEVPDELSWSYYQCAPLDQQLDPLQGGEWLVLDGMHPERARVRTALPTLRPAARALGVAGELGPLSCDMLVIDADALVLSLVWRGHVRLERGDELSRLHLVVGLAGPDRPVDWALLERSAPTPSHTASPPSELGEAAEGTLVADGVVSPALPFAVATTGPSTARGPSASSGERAPFSSAGSARVVIPGPASASGGDETLAVGEGTLGLGEAAALVAPHELPFSRPVGGHARAEGSEREPAMLPGAPWGPVAPAVPLAHDGEGTLSFDASPVGEVPHEPTHAREGGTQPEAERLAAPAQSRDEGSARSPWDNETAPPPSTRTEAPRGPPPPKPRLKTDPTSLALRLRSVGASAEVVGALLDALHPPPPPPPEDD